MKKRIGKVILVLCLIGVIPTLAFAQVIASTQSVLNDLTVYGYSFGVESQSVVQRPQQFLSTHKSRDVFGTLSSRAETLSFYIEDAAVVTSAIDALEYQFMVCMQSGGTMDKCLKQLKLGNEQLLSLPGVTKTTVTLKPNDRLILESTPQKGKDRLQISIRDQSGVVRQVSTMLLDDITRTNLLAPRLLIGLRDESTLGGYNGQPSVLLASNDDSRLTKIASAGQSLLVDSLTPMIAGINKLFGPSVAFAQSGGGGPVRVYTMNGYGQGRDQGADTFAGDVNALGDAVNRRGGDVDVAQVLYSDSWRGVGLTDVIKDVCRAICEDLKENPLEPGERVVIAGHSFGGLIALGLGAFGCDCLGNNFEVYAYDPPLDGVCIPGFFAWSQLSRDMSKGSDILRQLREWGERGGGGGGEGPTGLLERRLDENEDPMPPGKPGGEGQPDHDPWLDEDRGGRRDREPNRRERDRIRGELLDIIQGSPSSGGGPVATHQQHGQE